MASGWSGSRNTSCALLERRYQVHAGAAKCRRQAAEDCCEGGNQQHENQHTQVGLHVEVNLPEPTR